MFIFRFYEYTAYVPGILYWLNYTPTSSVAMLVL